MVRYIYHLEILFALDGFIFKLRLTSCLIILQVLFKHGCLPNSFNNAETLTIAHTSFIRDEVPAISSLLRETTNLKNLRILNPWNINVSEKVPCFLRLFNMGFNSINFTFFDLVV